MIEIRNDEIATPEAEGRWADLLAPMLTEAAASLEAVRVAS
jgi:predicted N-formylglutamate amidohydrolase